MVILQSNARLYVAESVWPESAKFRHFGEILNSHW